MLQNLWGEARRAGLEMLPKKTKILSNMNCRKGYNAKKTFKIGEATVEVLPVDGETEYLGRLLCFSAFHDRELDHRINKAWKKFHLFKLELCCNSYPLHERMRLFNAVITPSILYGCAAWTMDDARKKRLKSVQRRNLRLICKVGRKPKETWVDWVKRATHLAEKSAGSSGVECWVVGQKRRTFRWAGHVARLTDKRWTYQALLWQPASGKRAVGRPTKRWTDQLECVWNYMPGILNEDWKIIALERSTWKSAEDLFSA